MDQNGYPAEVVDTVRPHFYVDDSPKSVDSVEQATSLYRDLKELCHKGRFRLKKWITNHRYVYDFEP